MPLISKPKYNQIFASQAPSIDNPAEFNNYPQGWNDARNNNGKPTIKQFNYLQQTSDLKALWILQNGACLPYDETIDYTIGAPVLLDGIIQYKTADGFSPVNKETPYTLKYFIAGTQYPLNAEITLANGDKVQSTTPNNTNNPNMDMTGWIVVSAKNPITTVDSIADLIAIQDPKDGQVVFVKSNAEGYSSFYIYKPIEGGWIVKESKADATANIFTNRCNGFISLFEFIPKQYLKDIKKIETSSSNVGDVYQYVQEALDFAGDNNLDVLAPFGYYFVSKVLKIPPKIRFVGLARPYFLTTSNFVGESVFNTDNTGQAEYYIDGFNINGGGVNTPNLSALHVGGCRNSTFKNIVGTSCPNATVLVYPTNPDSGDIENIELDHIWTVRGAGIRFQTNSNIARGNITDGTITNCQLTSGDIDAKDGFPLLLVASVGKMIFGLKFDRIFTKTTDETHVFINPNGGAIYGNKFSMFTGESWVINTGGGPNPLFSQSSLFVMDGMFEGNTFDEFYATGLQGNGISLGEGSIGNIFSKLTVSDYQPAYNNKWFVFRVGANENTIRDVRIKSGLDVTNGATASNNIFGGKIEDNGNKNKVIGFSMSDSPAVLVKRDRIFANNGTQLTNYPVEGCAFSTTPDGNLSVTVPAGSAQFFLDIPFTNTAGYKGAQMGAFLNYQFNGSNNGLALSMHIGETGKAIGDFTVSKNNVMAFIAPLVSGQKKLTISFLGNRTLDATFIIKDIVIVEGGKIPYFYNYHKHYVES